MFTISWQDLFELHSVTEILATGDPLKATSAVKQLLQKLIHLGKNPASKDCDGNNLLHAIVKATPPGCPAFLDLLDYLINTYHIDPQEKDAEGNTLLHLAVDAGNDNAESFMRQLIELYHIQTEEKNDEEQTALECALMDNDFPTPTITLLLNKSAPIDWQEPAIYQVLSVDLQGMVESIYLPLLQCVCENNIEKAKQLLATADPFIIAELINWPCQGKPLLLIALEKKCIEMASLLLLYGASADELHSDRAASSSRSQLQGCLNHALGRAALRFKSLILSSGKTKSCSPSSTITADVELTHLLYNQRNRLFTPALDDLLTGNASKIANVAFRGKYRTINCASLKAR